MVVKEGKIIEATDAELFRLYLKEGWDGITDFYGFRRYMIAAGVKVTDLNLTCPSDCSICQLEECPTDSERHKTESEEA